MKAHALLQGRRSAALALVTWAVALLQSSSLVVAMVCPATNLSAPQVLTLARAADTQQRVAYIVDSGCKEQEIEAESSLERPGFFAVNADDLKLESVVSYPKVEVLSLRNNLLTKFAVEDESLKILDLSANKISSLEECQFPATLERLTLDLNPIKGFTASNFPSSLLELYVAKIGIRDLKDYDFPAGLQRLVLNGNEQLISMNGAVLPEKLTHLECSNCRIVEITGLRFPKFLDEFKINGAKVEKMEIRRSDLSRLKGMKNLQVELDASLECDDEASLETVSDTLSVCVLEDDVFDSRYPVREVKPGPPPSQASPPPGENLGAPGGHQDESKSSGGSKGSDSLSSTSAEEDKGSGNLILVIVVGSLVLVGVLVGSVLGWNMKRRKRIESSVENGVAVLGAMATNNKNDSLSQSSTSLLERTNHSDPPGSLNTGFLSNDVRNDEELIPYRLPHDELLLIEELATGGFGVVYQANLYNNTVVVKRVCPKKGKSPEVLRRFMDEIRLYARLEHPKIVRFIGVAWTNLMDLSLILEFMPNGDITSLLQKARNDPQARASFDWFSESAHPRSKALLALDVVEALVYLHSFQPPIIHRDLKARNILLGEDWTAKVADFGISREVVDETMTSALGTTAWTSPEVLQGDRYTEKADIFSFGILLSELDTCGHPYNCHRKPQDALTNAKIALLVSTQAIRPSTEDDCPESIVKLMMECISFDPSQRPTAVEIHYKLRKVRNMWLDQHGMSS